MADADRSGTYERDARDLRRGVLVNVAGYGLKLVYPVGTGFIVVVYGEAPLGVLIAAQAALLLIMRVGLLGLDKALHWWVARQPPQTERAALRPVLALTLFISAALSLALVTFAAPWIATWRSDPTLATSLRWLAVALVPMMTSEVLIAAALGKRRMEAQVVVKDGVVPVVFVGVALPLSLLPSAAAYGLPLAFVSSQLAGLVGAAWAFRRAFAASPAPTGPSAIPREMVRYAVPMWGHEVVNSLLQRIDILVLAALTNDATVGVYGVIVQVGNSMRAIRRAFDPIVLSIVARLGARRDLARVRAGVSYATSMIVSTQAPVYAFIVAFAAVMLPWLGPSFDEAVLPIVVFAGFWSVNGIVGLQGIVLLAYGRSDLSMLNLLVALAVQALLLWLLIPPFGLVGAAWAVGSATLVHNALASLQVRRIAGGWTYDPRLGWLIAMMPIAGLAMAVVWTLVSPASGLAGRVAGFAAFVFVQGACMLWLARTGRLIRGSERGPHPETARA